MKKFLALLLACGMILSFAACGQSGETSSDDTDTSSKSDYNGPMSLEEVKSPTKDPYEKYDPAITVSVVHTANDGAFWFPEGDSIEQNVYTRRYEEELGIKYEFKWTCPGS